MKEIVKYYTQRRGVLTFTAGIVYGFVRTRPELEEPDMQYHFAHASYATRADARAGPRARHDADGLPVPAGIERLDPHQVGRPAGGAGDPAELPAPRSWTVARIVAGMKIGRRIINNPVLDKYRAFEMNPGDKVQTDDEWLDFARDQRPDDLPRHRHVQDGAATRWRWSTIELRVHGHRRPARDRRLDHADAWRRATPTRGHHDRREGRRHDQGRREQPARAAA